MWISIFEKVAIIFGKFIPMVHAVFLLISAEMHFSKHAPPRLLHLILSSFQSWSSRLKVNLYTVLSKSLSLSLQLCLSQAPQGPVPYFPAVLLWQQQEWEKLKRKNWDFLPQIKDKFWLHLDSQGPKSLSSSCSIAVGGPLNTCQNSAEDQVPTHCFTSLADSLQVETLPPPQHCAAGVPQDRQHNLHPQLITVLTCMH